MGYKCTIGVKPFDGADMLESQLFGFYDFERCFLCGGAIDASDRWVFWSGFESVRGGGRLIYLHPDCAKTLGSHLIKDGFVTDGKAYRWPVQNK